MIEDNNIYKESEESRLAFDLIQNTGTCVFLTGKAGTGKTTFLKHLRQKVSKRMVVLAPTGVAAINAGGVTLHSFFQLPLEPYIPDSDYRQNNRYQHFSKDKLNIINSVDLIVIDEISMVRADVLDAVDASLRRIQ
jgi:DNA replication protein DnaC